jgi:hypothetical protein
VRAVELEHELNARIDRSINEPTAIARRPANQDRAGAAVTLTANDLCADQSADEAQKIRKGQEGIVATDVVAATIHKSEQMVQHLEEADAIETGSIPAGRFASLLSIYFYYPPQTRRRSMT